MVALSDAPLSSRFWATKGGSSSSQSSDGVSGDLSQIRNAQLEAALRRSDLGNLASRGPVSFTHLCGFWTDSSGNTVCVDQDEETFQHRLMATLMKPDKRKVKLLMKPVDRGCGWDCGDATMVANSAERVWWAFTNGRISTWTRQMRSAAVNTTEGSMWDGYGFSPRPHGLCQSAPQTPNMNLPHNVQFTNSATSTGSNWLQSPTGPNWLASPAIVTPTVAQVWMPMWVPPHW